MRTHHRFAKVVGFLLLWLVFFLFFGRYLSVLVTLCHFLISLRDLHIASKPADKSQMDTSDHWPTILEILPIEVLCLVCGYLSGRRCSQTASVSKAWCAIVTSSLFWSNRIRVDFGRIPFHPHFGVPWHQLYQATASIRSIRLPLTYVTMSHTLSALQLFLEADELHLVYQQEQLTVKISQHWQVTRRSSNALEVAIRDTLMRPSEKSIIDKMRAVLAHKGSVPFIFVFSTPNLRDAWHTDLERVVSLFQANVRNKQVRWSEKEEQAMFDALQLCRGDIKRANWTLIAETIAGVNNPVRTGAEVREYFELLSSGQNSFDDDCNDELSESFPPTERDPSNMSSNSTSSWEANLNMLRLTSNSSTTSYLTNKFTSPADIIKITGLRNANKLASNVNFYAMFQHLDDQNEKDDDASQDILELEEWQADAPQLNYRDDVIMQDIGWTPPDADVCMDYIPGLGLEFDEYQVVHDGDPGELPI